MIERFEGITPGKKITIEEEESKQVVPGESRESLILQVPEELVMEIFKMLDVRTFIATVPYVCKDWQSIVHGEKHKKQSGKLFKSHCLCLWQNSGLYSATSKYLSKFGNWR